MAIAFLAAVLLGCGKQPVGPPRGTAHGNVSLDGKPIAVGTITFAPKDAKAGPAWIGAVKDGRYASGAGGPIVGRSRVEICASRTEAAESSNDQRDWKRNYVEAVPARYNSQTTLEADVQTGENSFDFELKAQ